MTAYERRKKQPGYNTTLTGDFLGRTYVRETSDPLLSVIVITQKIQSSTTPKRIL